MADELAPVPDEQKYMTRAKAAVRYDVTERTIDRWLAEGAVDDKHVVRIGRSVRIEIAAMDEAFFKMGVK